MKRGTLDHPKARSLGLALGLKRWEVGGLLETIWHFAQCYAKRGDIGRWTNAQIAAGIEWNRTSPDELIEALVSCGWLDKCSEHRLLVHDWQDHADQTVRRSDDIQKLGFAKTCPDKNRTMLADASKRLADASLPTPMPTPMPKPIRPTEAVVAQPAETAVAPPTPPETPKVPRPRNEFWDAVVQEFTLTPATKACQTRIGKIARDLKLLGAQPAEVHERAERYRREWPDAECTPEALLKHWDRFSGNHRKLTPSEKFEAMTNERIKLAQEEEEAKRAQARV